MKWFLAKTVYRIICGEGDHKAQFDEQLRLVYADNYNTALSKAMVIGRNEEDTFYNQKQQLVQWKFINVPELYCLEELIDGAEMYSKINEVDDAEAYASYVHQKAAALQERRQEFTSII